MDNLNASLRMISQPALLEYIFRGVLFTVIISLIAVGLGILLGSLLALLRNYGRVNPIARVFRRISIIYIELFRNTPLLLWIFICLVFCPVPAFFNRKLFGLNSAVDVKILFKAAVALTLFTSSVIAEIIRGGLNSIPEGQFEAARSQGFNSVQVMVYIILPQAFRNVTPTLLSQVITTVKDSSYLANVAVIELMARTKMVMSAAGRYNGTGVIHVSDVFVLFGLAAAIYFIIDFSLSCIVRSMQKRRQKQPAGRQRI